MNRKPIICPKLPRQKLNKFWKNKYQKFVKSRTT